MHHPTDRITHTTAFGIPVVEHWLERELAKSHKGLQKSPTKACRKVPQRHAEKSHKGMQKSPTEACRNFAEVESKLAQRQKVNSHRGMQKTRTEACRNVTQRHAERHI